MRFVMESMVNVHRFCDKLLSTSAWGSELKWLTWYLLACVSPSTSAWGSELKYSSPNNVGSSGCLPLREVVSWNDELNCPLLFCFCLPLREVVSWNDSVSDFSQNQSGLPLREVVSWNIYSSANAFCLGGLPLREVVSWNIIIIANTG